ncbi:3665_t:CDS:2 [Ambispora gerdemannii]|uniref:3665_t:CDS:1 n=1 Tax=Ambispora gerdemannii TaxID=144530 RepID=A0A9N8WQE1_9GLOM|nr:3665_t:CDS:2 [Ambispora gerdemannii]
MQSIAENENSENIMDIDMIDVLPPSSLSTEPKKPSTLNLRVTIPDISTMETVTLDSATPTSADWHSDLYAETISSDSDVAAYENISLQQPKNHRIGPALINYAVTQQQGWETLGLRSKRAAKSTHPEIEDAFNVPRSINEQIHLPSQTQYNIFVLADGHGGAKAARHFCEVIPDNVREVLNSEKIWNFRELKDQQLFRTKMREMMKALDHEFLSLQKQKFSEWVAIGRPDPILADEGSTLIVLVLFDGVAIISNIGDSKTVLCKTLQSHIGNNSKIRLELIYQSTDQSPGHPQKAYHIYKNGGVFRREENEKIIKTKVNPPSTAPSSSSATAAALTSPTTTTFGHGKMYLSLQRARVSRPPGYKNPYGLPEDQSVNIGDTMGDLYFKLDPPLFPCEPDVEFVILESGVEYLGIVAPDGLWDHLIVKMPDFLRKVAKFLSEMRYQAIDYELDSSPYTDSSNSYSSTASSSSSSDSEIDGNNNQVNKCIITSPHAKIHHSAVPTSTLTGSLATTQEVLRELAISLCDRLEDPMQIFAKDQGRYDDCTVIAFSVKFEESQ